MSPCDVRLSLNVSGFLVPEAFRFLPSIAPNPTKMEPAIKMSKSGKKYCHSKYVIP
jgi:hypothetical protein